MQKLLLSVISTIAAIAAGAQCITNVDFNTWSKAGQPSNGNWVVQGGGSQVWQTINGDNTYFISPYDLMNVRITGNFRSTDDDNDWMGFVFSFLNPMGPIDTFDCWLYDWKQERQDGASPGMSLCRIDGVIRSSLYDATFWRHQNWPQFTVVQNTFGGPGWNRNYNHSFELRLTYTRATIYIDGNLVFDHQDCYKVGRFGFYNKSQKDCYYSNFQYYLYVDFTCTQQACAGDSASFEFITPCAISGVNSGLGQYQSIIWSFGDNSPDAIINNPSPATANVTHVYTAAGVYNATLTVVDHNGCTATATKQVDVRAPISLTPAFSEPPCNGGQNGSVSVTAAGGFGNYVYLWDGVRYGNIYNGITAGTYNVSATDGVCNATGQYTLGQPTAVSATTSHTNAKCGMNDGSVSITISGGTPPYQNVTWAGIPASGGPYTYTLTGLASGTLHANFTDFNGCSALLPYVETVAALPCGINSTVSVTDVTCFGDSTGSVTVIVTGGAPGGTITWSGGAIGSTINNLTAGNYSYTYSDNVPANTFSDSVIIRQPGGAMVAQLTTTAITCQGSNDGQATASVVSGGIPPYTYAWNGGVPGTNPVLSALSPGLVSVVVTDSNGCIATANGTISSVPSLTVAFTSEMDSCFGGREGSIIAHVNGGSPPYNFAWSNFFADSANMNLMVGTYHLTVTDRNNCNVIDSADVGGPDIPFAYTLSLQQVTCYGDSTGSININAVGGTPGYTYSWNLPIVTGNNPTGLAAGVYSFTITDSYGCIVPSGDTTLFQPDTNLIVTASHTDVKCVGDSTGRLTINVFGGVPPYTYEGNPISAGTTVFNNLPAGTYIGIVSDSNGCNAAIAEIIAEPTGPQTLYLIATDSICNGGANGTATADFINATGTVIYDWNPGGVLLATRNNLPAGIYIVTATDANNCTATASDTIAERAAPVLDVDTISALCFGANGSATANPLGGIPPYSYTWSVSSSNAQTVSLPAGSYSVTAQDVNFCNQFGVFSISEPPAQVLNVVPIDAVCFGANGSATAYPLGGIPPYSYTWSGSSLNQDTVSLPAGNHSVTAQDVNLCGQVGTFTINEPSEISVIAQPVNLKCFEDNTGSLTLAVSGGAVPVYTYTWSPNVSASGSAMNLAAGVYDITVADGVPCSVTKTIIINQPYPLDLSVSGTDVECFGQSTGTVTPTASGGINPYNFILTSDGISFPNSSNGQFQGLAADSYTVVVSDSGNLCHDTATVTITEPSLLTNAAGADDVTCFGFVDGQITVTSSGGAAPYTYSLSGEQNTTGIFSGLGTGSYMVTITDGNNCTATAPALVNGADEVLVTITPAGPIETKVGITLPLQAATNQTGAVTYAWEPDLGLTCYTCSDPFFNGTASAVYSVTALNSNGCPGKASIDITVIQNYDIYIPNAFTPTGDGTNDDWEIFGNRANIKDLNIKVFNRWGELVFESGDINFRWDGTYRGKELVPDVYVYYAGITWLDNHPTAHLKGSVTLLR